MPPKNCLSLIKGKGDKANSRKIEDSSGCLKVEDSSRDRVTEYQTNRVCQRSLSYRYELEHMARELSALPSL